MSNVLNQIMAFVDVEEIDVSALDSNGRSLEHRKIQVIASPDDGSLIVRCTESSADRTLTLLNVGDSVVGTFTLIKKGASNSVTRVRVWK